MMSKFEAMKEAQLKATAAQSEISKIIRDSKRSFDNDSAAVRTDRHLSAEGRMHEMDKLRKKLDENIKEKAAKLRKQYEEADAKAREIAREILAENAHAKPSDSAVALFERELTDLKTRLMLEIRENNALQLIREFESKYSDGYFADALLDEMPGFISTVVNLADDKHQARVTLKRMYDDMKHRSMTDEQREAAQLLEYGRAPFISRAGMDHRLLNELFGAHTAHVLTKEE